MEEILIRTANPFERMACQSLLARDQVPLFYGRLEYLIAVEARTSRLAGAASFVWIDNSLAGVRLRVIRPWRRQGIGTRLLQELNHVAARGAAARIYGVAISTPDEDHSEAFLSPHGFRRIRRILTVEGHISGLAGYFSGLCEKLRNRNRIPAGLRAVRLGEAPREGVRSLVAAHLRHQMDPGSRLMYLMERSCFVECPVVLHGDCVVGVLLWEVHGDVASVPARVVAPEWAGSAVNALLLERASMDGVDRGIDRVQFDIPEGNADTGKLAARYGAVPVSIQDQYVKEFRA